MVWIEIREQRRLADGRFKVGIRLGGSTQYCAVVEDPFSPEDEALLAWYLEEHRKFPFVREVDARKAAASIGRYGEALFGQLFAGRRARLAYQRQIELGGEALAWTVAGSESFHRLHWEALKDPQRPRAFALEGPMVRQPRAPLPFAAPARSWPALHLLLVVARPFGPQDVGARTISHPLVEMVRAFGTARVEVFILRPGTYQALQDHLLEVRGRKGAGYYHAVHFDVHGGLLTYEKLQKHVKAGTVLGSGRYGRSDVRPYSGHKAFLYLEGDHDGRPADPVEAGEIAALLDGHQIPVAILNACQSGRPLEDGGEGTLGSRLLEAGLQVVLAMRYSVSVLAAQILMDMLYRQLFAGEDLETAILRGRLALHRQPTRKGYFNQPVELEDWLMPMVYQNSEVRFAVRDLTPAEARSWSRRKGGRFRPPPSPYGFVGRDLDVLTVERRLVEHNLLLVQGMAGAGKTTLLQHLGAWWQETGWVDRVIYFGWDERGWDLQQVVDAIAARLLPKARYAGEYRSLPPGAQSAWMIERLRRARHLLIFDNLESITGSPLSISHSLHAEAREALRRFLGDLRGGKTRVLLGSRGAEGWLAAETFGTNIHGLAGLDEEAASALADRVLERAEARERREDEDLIRLLHLLAGYPLAIQVVLRNLVRQSPRQILDALEAGDLALDAAGTGDKTESLIACIDYSFRQLSAAAQGLLVCLAPFAGVVGKKALPRYVELLRREPALAHLPFEDLEEAMQEAEGWGLLGPHEVAGFRTVQPTLPYFLRARLQAERTAERQAIERAFRAHFEALGEELASWLVSGEPRLRQWSQRLVGLESENLSTALELALDEQVSIEGPYRALSLYLDARHDLRRGLELGRRVQERLEALPLETLDERLTYELSMVVDSIAARHLRAQELTQAEAAYQREYEVLQGLRGKIADSQMILLAGVCHQLGCIAQLKRHWERAARYYRQALEVFAESGWDDRQAVTFHNLGMVEQARRHWALAETYYQKALEIKIARGDRFAQAGTYAQLGALALEQRRWKLAEASYRQALEINIDANDRHAQAQAYHQLGMIEEERRKWRPAEASYQKALQIYIELKDRRAQARTYHQLGIVAQAQRQWQQAESYYLRALEIKSDFNDRYSQAHTCYQLGTLAQRRHQRKKAESYYRQALETYIDLGEPYPQAKALGQLALLAQDRRQWAKAREYLLSALQIFISEGDSKLREASFHNLALLWQESGDATLPEAVGRLLDTTTQEAEKRFREILAGGR